MTTTQRAMAWSAGLIVFVALVFLLRDILRGDESGDENADAFAFTSVVCSCGVV